MLCVLKVSFYFALITVHPGLCVDGGLLAAVPVPSVNVVVSEMYYHYVASNGFRHFLQLLVVYKRGEIDRIFSRLGESVLTG